jgi:two-component system cell cycle sensor histidine kinase/response regulator CckA
MPQSLRLNEPKLSEAVRQALLAGSNARLLHALVEAFPGSWYFTRMDGTFSYVNETACRSLGYSREELLALSVFDINPSITPELWQQLVDLGPLQPGSVRTEHRKKDGTTFPVEAFGSQIVLDGEHVAVSYVVDMSQEAKARQDLHAVEAANRKLLRAIEQATDSIVLMDARGVVEYVNPAFETTSGYSALRAVGKRWAAIDVNSDSEFSREVSRRIDQGQTWQGTRRGRRPDGKEFIEHVTLAPLQDPARVVTGFVAVHRDLTEQVHAQERLRHAQKMDAIGRLAGGVAHDFNNILQVVLGNALMCLQTEVPDKTREMLAEIEAAAQRAGRLVNQLLTFSRKDTVEPATIALDQLVNRMLSLIRRLLGEHITIDSDLSGDHWTVWGDHSQLEQIVLNLCVNARDAMPDGGRILLTTRHQHISRDEALAHGTPLAGDYLVLTVQDEGRGIDQEVQRRMFEPFFTTKGAGEGTGLGLATVYAVVQRHGGAIEVESAPGAGSSFRVFLPAAQGEATDSTLAVEADLRGGGALVLVAEDDEAVRRVTDRYLRDAGYRVVSASDGAEAVEVIQQQHEQLGFAVLDVVMPRVGGVQVYRHLRQVSKVPVVLVSGYGFDALESLPADSTCTILHKPFAATDLLKCLRDLRQQ